VFNLVHWNDGLIDEGRTNRVLRVSDGHLVLGGKRYDGIIEATTNTDNDPGQRIGRDADSRLQGKGRGDTVLMNFESPRGLESFLRNR
jgi:hypothetical protein